MALSFLTGKGGMLSLERFYGPANPESDRKEGTGPTKNCDIYLVEFQPYMYRGYRMMCMISAGQVQNGHIKKDILCYELKGYNAEQLKNGVINYLSGKTF